ncbi:MAG: methyltransferase domain-containing protein [Rhizomicrobium sp.]|jgi:phosphatidylethanolamine/phosphatidyl-N-methylethanolamine N-methyltransferase
MADSLRFLRRLVTSPKTIGAIAPSSAGLARAMAMQTDPRRTGPVLELGPGTGVVTKALIARGFAPERIVAIEYDRALATLMSQRFPGVRIVCGDAFDLQRTLGGSPPEPFAAIVSSLPLLNFPLVQRAALISTALAMAAPGAPFVQFSYGFSAPVPSGEHVSVVRAAFIPFNLPPARVWVYRRA